MHEPEDKKEDIGAKLEDIWDKVSKGVEEGLKVGKDEIVRTAKIGKIRLDIASVKSSKSEKIRLLGARAYGLLLSGDIKSPQLDDLLEDLKELDAQIDSKEEDIQAIMEEKIETEEGVIQEEAVEAEVLPPETEEVNSQPEPSKKKRGRKKKVVSASTDDPQEKTEDQESTEEKAE